MTKKQIMSMTPNQFADDVAVDPDLKKEIADNMKNHGGGFFKALGAALVIADALNARKLAIVFYAEFTFYATWGEE